MRAKIIDQNGNYVNTIVGNLDWIEKYCLNNNYVFEQENESSSKPNISVYKTEKEAEISTACNKAIISGMDVETTQGTEHFSLEETDQINLTTAYNAIMQGVEYYPYHSDGNLCRMFTADEIKAINNESIKHKIYHTTLCNHLLTWIRRAKTVEEINSITYSADNLPEDLRLNFELLLKEIR